MNRRQFVESLIAAAALPAVDGLRGYPTLEPQAPGSPAPATTRPAPTLWYGRAATKWVEALPVGNGRLGAMVFGDVGVERLQINDDTLWSGGPGGWEAPAPRRPSPTCGASTLAGDYAAADKAARGLMGAFTQSYLPLGDVWLTFEHGNLGRNYRRELHLGDAVAARALPGRRRPLHARGDRQRAGRRHRRTDRRRPPRPRHLRRARRQRAATRGHRGRRRDPPARRRAGARRAELLPGRRAGAVRPRWRRPGRPMGRGRDAEAAQGPPDAAGHALRAGRRRRRRGRHGLDELRPACASRAPMPRRCCSRRRRRSTASTRIRPATAATPAPSSCGSSPPLARPRGPPCATPMSPTIASCSIA